ncbi:MAG: hypothetical protein R2834_19305 [Rhodothermales bacterium]
MKANPTSRVIVALGLLAVIVVSFTASPANGQIFKIPYADTSAASAFGVSVAIDGNRALVGASAENNCGPNSGAVYVFERDSELETWVQMARLTPRDCVEGDFFGHGLSLSGNRALITASGNLTSRNASNAAYVFERDSTSGEWVEAAKIVDERKEEEGSFAASVSLDGDRALITTSGDPIRHRYAGAAYIYERHPVSGRWIRSARLSGSGGLAQGVFGGNAALDGDVAVITSSMYYREKPGSIYVFERDPSTDTWHEAKRFGGIDDILISVDISHGRILVGESRDGDHESGAATLYEKTDAGEWTLSQTLHPRVPYKHGAFGSEVSFDGDSALIAGYDEQLGKNFNIDRVVYEFKRKPDGEWTQRRIFDVGAVAFGYSLAASGEFAVIGEHSDQEPGAAYVVRLR